MDPASRRPFYEEEVVWTERVVELHMLIGLICPTEDGRTERDSARESWCTVKEVFLFLLYNVVECQVASLVLSTLDEGTCVCVRTGPQEGHNETACTREYISAMADDNSAGDSG